MKCSQTNRAESKSAYKYLYSIKTKSKESKRAEEIKYVNIVEEMKDRVENLGLINAQL
jgi:hypothetical protein